MKSLKTQHGPDDAFDGPVILLDDIVEVLRLALHDRHTGVGLHAVDGGRVGAALIDRDRLGQAMPADGATKRNVIPATASL